MKNTIYWNHSPYDKRPARCTYGIAAVSIYEDGGSYRVKLNQPGFVPHDDCKFSNLDEAVEHAEESVKKANKGHSQPSPRKVLTLRQVQSDWNLISQRAEALGYKDPFAAMSALENMKEAAAPEHPLSFILQRRLPDVRIDAICDAVQEEIELGNLTPSERVHQLGRLRQFRAAFGHRIAHSIEEPNLLRWTANRGNPALSSGDIMDVPALLERLRQHPADAFTVAFLGAMEANDRSRLLSPDLDWQREFQFIHDACNKALSGPLLWHRNRLPGNLKVADSVRNAVAAGDTLLANRNLMAQACQKIVTKAPPAGHKPKSRYEYWLTAARVMKKAYKRFGAISDRMYNLVRDHQLYQAKSGVLYEILEPDEWRQLVERCETRSQVLHLYLGAGTPIRVSEFDRRDSKEIEWDSSGCPYQIVIPDPKAPDQSKGSTYRVVPLKGAITEVLKAFKPTGPLLPAGNCQPQLAVFAAELGFPWVHNILRRTFLSYMAALKNDDEALAEDAGNSTGVLKKHYLRKASPEKAREFLFYVSPKELLQKWASLPE